MTRLTIIWQCVAILFVLSPIAWPSPVNMYGSENSRSLEIRPSSTLVKRAPRLFSNYQLRLLMELCQDLEERLQEFDFVLFVGNSGSYMKYCFDHPRMGAIPLSKARRYDGLRHPERDREGYGRVPHPRDRNLRNYYEWYLGPKFRQLRDMRINRFYLVDHSSQGKSVDATRIILKDAMRSAAPHNAEIGENRYDRKPYALYNVIDRRKCRKFLLFSWIKGIKDPKEVSADMKATAGRDGEVDRLLGDEGYHFRNQLDYWPARFDTRTQQLWAADPQGWTQAQQIRTQIINYIRRHNNNRLMSPRRLSRR